MALELMRRFSLPQIDWSLSLDWGTIHFQHDLTVSSGSHGKRRLSDRCQAPTRPWSDTRFHARLACSVGSLRSFFSKMVTAGVEEKTKGSEEHR